MLARRDNSFLYNSSALLLATWFGVVSAHTNWHLDTEFFKSTQAIDNVEKTDIFAPSKYPIDYNPDYKLPAKTAWLIANEFKDVERYAPSGYIFNPIIAHKWRAFAKSGAPMSQAPDRFKHMSTKALALLVMIADADDAKAYFPHSGGVRPPCMTYTSQILNDGCATAPAGGQFTTPVFTTMRQVGQVQYFNASGIQTDHPAAFNVPGQDYANGPTSPDSSLITVTSSTSISGCTNNVLSNGYMRCNGNATISGYNFYDVGLFYGGAGSSDTFTLTNIHATVGAVTCRLFSGLPFLRGPTNTVATSFQIDVDETVCSPYAYLYKQQGDPGLTTNSSGSANIADTGSGNATVTYPGGLPVGAKQYQYINIPGGLPAIITSIAGNVATVCSNPWYPTSNNFVSINCSGAQPTQTGITVTTGPLQATFGAGISGNNTQFHYGVTLGFGTSFQTNGNSGQAAAADVKYNYEDLTSTPGTHNQCMVWEPNTTSAVANISDDENFNVCFYDKLAAQNSGTGASTVFGNGPSATAQTTFSHVNMNYNVIGSNSCSGMGTGWQSNAAGSGCVNGSPNNSLVRLVTQSSQPTFSATATLTPGATNATITVSSSGGTIVAGATFNCPSCQNTMRVAAIGGSTCGALNNQACTGAGGAGTYPSVSNLDTISTPTAMTVMPVQGIINSFSAIGNLFDGTGDNGLPFNIGFYDFWVQAWDFISDQNTNMINGHACFPTTPGGAAGSC